MENKVNEYGRMLLEELDHETGGRMFTRYDIEIAKMGYKAGYMEAVRMAGEWLKMHLVEWSQMDDANLEDFRKYVVGDRI